MLGHVDQPTTRRKPRSKTTATMSHSSLATSSHPPQAKNADSSADTCRVTWNVLAFASTARHVSAAKRKAANGRTLNSPLSWQFGWCGRCS